MMTFARLDHRSLKHSQLFCSLFAAFLLAGAYPARAQDPGLQYTRNTVESNRRSLVEVDPATNGLNLTLPLAEFVGRGAGLPITLRYSSKLWRVNHLSCQVDSENPNPLSQIYYSENSASGWSSTLGIPWVEEIGDAEPFILYFRDGVKYETAADGRPWDGTCAPQAIPLCSDPGPGCYAFPVQYYVPRVRLHMPDGSSHELRAGDHALWMLSSVNKFTAVDGSGIIYDKSTQTVYLPDGSRYLLNYWQGQAYVGAQYIDRNGNTLTYNQGLGQWMDTTGRIFTNPPGQTHDRLL